MFTEVAVSSGRRLGGKFDLIVPPYVVLGGIRKLRDSVHEGHQLCQGRTEVGLRALPFLKGRRQGLEPGETRGSVQTVGFCPRLCSRAPVAVPTSLQPRAGPRARGP